MIINAPMAGSIVIYGKGTASGNSAGSKTFSNVMPNVGDEDVWAVAMAICSLRKFPFYDIKRVENGTLDEIN